MRNKKKNIYARLSRRLNQAGITNLYVHPNMAEIFLTGMQRIKTNIHLHVIAYTAEKPVPGMLVFDSNLMNKGLSQDKRGGRLEPQYFVINMSRVCKNKFLKVLNYNI